MVWSSLAPKWPIPVPLCGIDHQKSNFSLISDTLSVGSCWGRPMSFFWKVVDETQISKPPEATRHHNSIKLLVLLPLRADLLYILHYETPCNFYIQALYGSQKNNGFSFYHDLIWNKSVIHIGPYLIVSPRVSAFITITAAVC